MRLAPPQTAIALFAVSGLAALNACTGAAPSAAVPFAASPHSSIDSTPSWMSSQAKAIPLLYVSDQVSNDVYVYDYRKQTLVGTLTGFTLPAGQCEDKDGNIWITDVYGERVYEYAHGGSRALKTLTTSGEPNGCAIDPVNGDLAVTEHSRKNGNAAVLVYKSGAGRPKQFVSPSFPNLWPPAYDNRGNLYVEGSGTHQAATGAGAYVLLAGGDSLKTLSLPVMIHASGAAWDGKHIVLTDDHYDAMNQARLYRMRFSGTKATVVGSTDLATTQCNGSIRLLQPFVVGTTNTPETREEGHVLLGSDEYCYPSPLLLWKYPAGGETTKVLWPGSGGPEAQTVSFPP